MTDRRQAGSGYQQQLLLVDKRWKAGADWRLRHLTDASVSARDPVRLRAPASLISMDDTERAWKPLWTSSNSCSWHSREDLEDVRVLETRVPSDWGADYHLYRDSMNQVMSRWYMGVGRLTHRSRYVHRLYFAGSSTFPGYSVSFCIISGVLAAQAAIADRGWVFLRHARKSLRQGAVYASRMSAAAGPWFCCMATRTTSRSGAS
jgi:hypothetical protein